MTEKDNKSRLLDSGLNTKAYKLGNPFIDRLKYDVEDSSELKFSDAKLPRKASRANCIDTRTENRHRWSRRVS